MKTTEKINLNPMKNGSQTNLIIGKNTGIEILIKPNEIEATIGKHYMNCKVLTDTFDMLEKLD
jgi:hypothetical protein